MEVSTLPPLVPIPMAPSLLAAVSASPFLLAGSGSSRRPLGAVPTRRAGLRVAALKYDPAKVAPQNDRVLVRLQQIPEFANCWRRSGRQTLEVYRLAVPSAAARRSAALGRTATRQQKSAGGVLLPKSAVKFERYLMGEILSVGADVSEVEAGKKVLFSDINAYEVDLDTDEKHCFCWESDLLAVVE